MKSDFKIYFNKRKQWISIFLEDVSPATFKRRGGGRWAYFLPTWTNPRAGSFGEIHFVKSVLRSDTIVHEVFHIVCEWAWASGEVIVRNNEESYARLLHDIYGKIEKKLKKMELL